MTWGGFFAFSLMALLLLDWGVFRFRDRFYKVDVGEWNEPQWRARRKMMEGWQKNRPLGYLVLGDSGTGYGIRPAILDPDGFNLSRLGLQESDLGLLQAKLETLLPSRPRAVLLGMFWYEFLGGDAENGFLVGQPPAVSSTLLNFYREPQRSQVLLLPGTRLARLFLDTRIEKVQGIRTPNFRLAPDGSAEVNCPPPRAVPDDPPLWSKVRPGWFDLGRLGEMKLFVAHLDQLRLPQCFIFLPMHPGFRRKYLDDFGTEHAKWKAAVTEVYGGRVIDLEDALQDPKYYRDASHLNGEGAILLSQILKDRIETEGPIRPLGAALDPSRSAGGAPLQTLEE